MMEQERRVYGVDFSGARDAGRKIWIATGRIRGAVLCIGDCRRASELPGSATDRASCLKALREFIAEQKESVFGLDFPFGLPRDLVKELTWKDFILGFGDRHQSPDLFRCRYFLAARGRESKRVTDEESATPFCPYNLRIYRQTFYGIRNVLGPLVKSNSVRVLPMQKRAQRKAIVIEICPASTLKYENASLSEHQKLSLSYKGKGVSNRQARSDIVDCLMAKHDFRMPNAALRSTILDDHNGDALDSVIAALATFRALNGEFCTPSRNKRAYMLEGYVYV